MTGKVATNTLNKKIITITTTVKVHFLGCSKLKKVFFMTVKEKGKSCSKKMVSESSRVFPFPTFSALSCCQQTFPVGKMDETLVKWIWIRGITNIMQSLD